MGHAHAQSCVCVCVADKEMNTKINLEQQQQQEEAAAAATPIQFNPIALFRLSFFDSHFEYFLIKTTKRNLFYICCCCSWLYMCCCCCCLMSYLGCCLAANGTRTQNGALKTSSAAAHLNNKSSCSEVSAPLPFLSFSPLSSLSRLGTALANLFYFLSYSESC